MAAAYMAGLGLYLGRVAHGAWRDRRESQVPAVLMAACASVMIIAAAALLEAAVSGEPRMEPPPRYDGPRNRDGHLISPYRR